MIQRRLLLEPNSPVTEGGGEIKHDNFTQKTIPGAKEPSATVKAVEFKADSSLLEPVAGDIKPDAVNVQQSFTPLDAAKAMLEEPKVEPKKEEAKKAEPTAKTVEAPKVVPTEEFVQKPIAPKSSKEAKEFDYSGFSQEEASALRQMSTGARDFALKVIKEKKELESQKGGQFMQHPNAYTLDPQFNILQEDVFYGNKEAAYWQDQLAKVKSGENWNPVTGWDKNGNPILGTEQTPTAVAEEQIRLMMNRCYQAVEVKQQELQQFVGTYKQRVQQDSSAIQAERVKRFGWVGNPEILKETVILDNGKEESVAEIRNTLINLFPPYMRNTAGVEVAADLFAAIQIYGQELREARAGKQTAEVQAKEITRAEPKSTAGAGKEVRGVKEFSLAGMPV